jgi:hypothetical protein
VTAKSGVQSYHFKLFPEEYDFQYDSNADVADRKSGISPMSREYIDKVNKRRVALGFSPCESGLFDSNETYSWVETQLSAGKEAELEALATRFLES